MKQPTPSELLPYSVKRSEPMVGLRVSPRLQSVDVSVLPNLVTAEEIAPKVHLTVERILELARAGYAPCWWFDELPLFQVSDMKRWVLKNITRIQPGSDYPGVLQIASFNPAEPGNLPDALKPAARALFQSGIYGRLPCIYFLCRERSLVYVGQTVCLGARLETHRSEGAKHFDRAFYLPCLEEHLNGLEGALIRALRPEYNFSGPRLVAPSPHGTTTAGLGDDVYLQKYACDGLLAAVG